METTVSSIWVRMVLPATTAASRRGIERVADGEGQGAFDGLGVSAWPPV